MKKIEQDIQESKLTDIQRLQKQLKQGKKTNDKEIIDQLHLLKQKRFSIHFKVQSRDRREEVFSNKTNPPAVGHYHPKKDVVLSSIRAPHIDEQHELAMKAHRRKI